MKNLQEAGELAPKLFTEFHRGLGLPGDIAFRELDNKQQAAWVCVAQRSMDAAATRTQDSDFTDEPPVEGERPLADRRNRAMAENRCGYFKVDFGTLRDLTDDDIALIYGSIIIVRADHDICSGVMYYAGYSALFEPLAACGENPRWYQLGFQVIGGEGQSKGRELTVEPCRRGLVPEFFR